MTALVVLALCVMLYSTAVVAQACEAATTCTACFAQSGCGWCVSDGKCLAGNQLGPTAMNSCRGVANKGTVRERQLWYFAKSQVLSTTAGFPVNPVTASVYLKPGEPAIVRVQVTAPLPTDQDLDIMFVQDTSGSMADDIQIFRTLATSLVNAVLKLSKTAQTGLASFIEKPVFPQGFPPGDDKYLLADGSVRNYAYRLESKLESSSLALQSALFKLDATSNRDLPEAAFEALSQVLVCDKEIGWRSEARKIVVLTTDAKFHAASDPVEWGENGSARMPGWDEQCYGTAAGVKYLRENNNYPSRAQIAKYFKQKNIIPIFAIAHNPRDFTTPTEIEFWRQFQRMDVGFGATVQLSDNSDNLIDLIVTALTAFNQEIALVITQDAKRIITGLTDVNNQGSIQSGAVYKGVQAGTTKDFLVTLSTATPVAGEKLVLTSPGFGSVVIDVTSNFPCADCAGSPGGALKWDRCDECGGKDACVGCDMVAFSGKVLDQCGVCGGANLCNRACTTGLVDQCGVCGGQNLCLGCDGVPNSLAVKDACGVCGGQNDCIGCDGRMNGKKLDMCGVCGGGNECVGCDGVPYLDGKRVPVYDKCGVCDGNNACQCDKDDPTKMADQCGYCGKPGDGLFNRCLGCDGTPDSGFIYDLCGVCAGQNDCISDCDGQPFGERRDLCGICGGDSSTCVNFNGTAGRTLAEIIRGPEAEQGAASLTAVYVAVPLALLICAALVVAFFIFKSRQDPQWLLPAGMRDNLNAGLAENPLFESTGGWQQNAISET